MIVDRKETSSNMEDVIMVADSPPRPEPRPFRTFPSPLVLAPLRGEPTRTTWPSQATGQAQAQPSYQPQPQQLPRTNEHLLVPSFNQSSSHRGTARPSRLSPKGIAIWDNWSEELRSISQTTFQQAFPNVTDWALSNTGLLKDIPLQRYDYRTFESSNRWDPAWRKVSTLLDTLNNDKRLRTLNYLERVGYHPNNLIISIEDNLPRDGKGMVDQRTMKQQVRTNELTQALYNAGLLAMEPHHFELWRMSLKYEELMRNGNGFSIRQILRNIVCEISATHYDRAWPQMCHDARDHLQEAENN